MANLHSPSRPSHAVVGVAEVVARHVRRLRDDRVEAGLVPLPEEQVRRVLGEGHVLHLHLVGVASGVEDGEAAVGHRGGRPRPAAPDVEGGRRIERRAEEGPVDEVAGGGVAPGELAGAKQRVMRVVLVEVVHAVVVQRPCHRTGGYGCHAQSLQIKKLLKLE